MEARCSTFTDLVVPLRQSLVGHSMPGYVKPVTDHRRDRTLASYHQRFSEQLRHDLHYNIVQLSQAAKPYRSLFKDELDRLHQDAQNVQAQTKDVTRWGYIQRFFYYALNLAHALTAYRQGVSVTQGYGWWQRQVDDAEILTPNLFIEKYPAFAYKHLSFWVGHYVWPWSTFRQMAFMKSLLPWVRGIEHIRQQPSEGIQFSSALSEADRGTLFSPDGSSRHNIILAYSHRLGFLDIPLLAHLLQDIPHAVWINADNYPHRLRQKIARDETSIFVRGSESKIRDILDQSVKLLIEGKPIRIAVDGVQSNLMYGQQNTMKKGLRLLVDESIKQIRARGLARKTLVIPITLSDPVGFILNQSDKLIVHMHKPLEISEPSCSEHYRSYFDKTKYNGGDALLSQLEALFLLHTNHLYSGWTTPDVMAAVEHKHQQGKPWGLRSWLQAKANTSVFELSRYAQGRPSTSHQR